MQRNVRSRCRSGCRKHFSKVTELELVEVDGFVVDVAPTWAEAKRIGLSGYEGGEEKLRLGFTRAGNESLGD